MCAALVSSLPESCDLGSNNRSNCAHGLWPGWLSTLLYKFQTSPLVLSNELSAQPSPPPFCGTEDPRNAPKTFHFHDIPANDTSSPHAPGNKDSGPRWDCMHQWGAYPVILAKAAAYHTLQNSGIASDPPQRTHSGGVLDITEAHLGMWMGVAGWFGAVALPVNPFQK